MAEHAWSSSFGPIASLPASVHIAQNESAGRMPQWVAQLGGPAAISTFPFSSANTPAADVVTYVQTHQAALDQVADEIVRNPAPSWPMSRDWRSPITDLIAAGGLERALLSGVFVRARAGDDAGAERLLLASWRINESLRDRPEVMAQLYAVAVYRTQCAALRMIGVDPAIWRKRLQEHDYRATMLTACKFATWSAWRDVRENVYAKAEYQASMRDLAPAIGIPYRVRPQWLLLATTPIRWFDLPPVLEGSRQVLLEAQRVPVRDGDGSNLAAAQDRGFSSWSYIRDPDVQPPNLFGPIRRADGAIAEGELTDRVLWAKAERARNGGQWPASIDGFGQTRIANGQWIYERTPGGISIHFSRHLAWLGIFGDPVPMSFSAPN